jgi:hypothetical protein
MLSEQVTESLLALLQVAQTEVAPKIEQHKSQHGCDQAKQQQQLFVFHTLKDRYAGSRPGSTSGLGV